MNSQQEAVRRPFPLAIVAYQIYLRLLHSGKTADEVLKMDDVGFGQFIAECFQITRDAHMVSYQGDETPGFAQTADGKVTLRCKGTENMVYPSPIPVFLCVFVLCCVAILHTFALLLGRPCRARPRSFWVGTCASSPHCRSRGRVRQRICTVSHAMQ